MLNKYMPMARHKAVKLWNPDLTSAMISSDFYDVNEMRMLPLYKHTNTNGPVMLFTLAGEHRPCRHRGGYCGISIPGGGYRIRTTTSVLGADILLWTEGV